MAAKNWALLAILSFLWGGSFLFVELALEGLPVLTLVWLRVAGAALVLALWAGIRGHGFAKGVAAWRTLAVMGLLNNVLPFSLLVFAQGQIEAGLAAILNATTPLWTVLVAHVFTTDERLTPAKALGIGLGLGGVAVIAGGGAGQALAIAACLAAALSYGFAGVWGRRFKPMGLAPPQVAFGMLASSSLILLPVWLGVERPWTLARPEAGALWAVAALAVLSTALAYLIFFRILASAGAVFLSLVTLLIPPSVLLLGIVVLGEALQLRHLAGMGLILLGLLAMDGRWAKWRG